MEVWELVVSKKRKCLENGRKSIQDRSSITYVRLVDQPGAGEGETEVSGEEGPRTPERGVNRIKK